MDEILKLIEKLASIEGAADLAKELKTAADKAKVDLDTARSEAKKAEKTVKELSTERDKLKVDLEAASKGEGEQVAKLKVAADKAKQELDAEKAAHRAFRLETKIASKLEIPDVEDAAARREAALKLGDWSEVDLDDKGELVGADTALDSLKKAHGYLFTPGAPPAKGYGGPAGGASPKGAPPKDADDPKKAEYERGRQAAIGVLDRRGQLPRSLAHLSPRLGGGADDDKQQQG